MSVDLPTESAPDAARSDFSALASTVRHLCDIFVMMGGASDHELVREFIRSGGYGRALASVRAVCGSATDAEDAVQDALASALSRDDVRNLGPWVAVVAINRVRQTHRRAARMPSRLAIPRDEWLPDVEVHDEVLAALRQLAERQREAVVLHYFWDLSVLEVAGLLGVSAGTVKVQLHRARRRLRDLISATEEVGT